MDTDLQSQLEQALLERCQAIASSWYQVIAQTGYVPVHAAEVRRQLAGLARQAAALLVAEPFDHGRAQEIGLSLARLHYLGPEALGQTIGILAGRFTEGLPADQAAALQPGLAVLLDGVTTGFARQATEMILAEQETIRAALIGELRTTERLLREARDGLESKIRERTAELAQVNEELRLEIAERKQAEQALQESRNTTRALLDALGDRVALVDTGGFFLDINEAMARRYGKEAGDLIGTCGWDGLSPGELERVKPHFEEVLRSEKPVRFETERQGRWFDTVDYPVRDANGLVTKVAIFTRDITERKRMEEALRESEKTARALLNAPTDMNVLLDPRGMLLDANGMFASKFGKRVEDLVGTCIWDLFPPEIAEFRKAIFTQVIQSGEPCRFEEDRAGRWYDTIVHPILDPQGKVARVAVLAHDIDDRKAAERALRESEERWRSLVENAPDIGTTVDRMGRILFTNRLIPESTLTMGDMIGMEGNDLAMPEARDLAMRSLERVFVEGSSEYIEVPVLSSNGTVAWYANRIGPIRQDGAVIAAIVLSRDITGQRQIEDIKDNIIRDVSHELRTPLAKMQMSLDLLLEVLNKEPINRQKAIRIAEMVFGNTQRSLQTVEAILDLSALEAGRIIYNKTRIAPGDLIRDAVQDMQPMALAKGLELVARVPDNLPAIDGDRGQLFRVLINLVDNAIKFSEQGQILLTVPEDGPLVQFAVSDQGCGIYRENLPKVFDRFYQERPKIAGAGVGLSICKTIVEAHGGRIWVESPGRGQGTTVRFTLPAKAGEG